MLEQDFKSIESRVRALLESVFSRNSFWLIFILFQDLPDYRLSILIRIPHLVKLDNIDVLPEEKVISIMMTCDSIIVIDVIDVTEMIKWLTWFDWCD